MNNKVMINVTEGHNFHSSVYDGGPYKSVDFSANTYGCACPCRTDEEVNSAIKMCKNTIIENDDVPVLNDERKKAKLTNWFGGD